MSHVPRSRLCRCRCDARSCTPPGGLRPGKTASTSHHPCPRPGERTGPPEFVGIGAQKAGTTWWFGLVASHPDVAQRDDIHKERHFFDRYATRSFGPQECEQYRAWFPRPMGRSPVSGHRTTSICPGSRPFWRRRPLAPGSSCWCVTPSSGFAPLWRTTARTMGRSLPKRLLTPRCGASTASRWVTGPGTSTGIRSSCCSTSAVSGIPKMSWTAHFVS